MKSLHLVVVALLLAPSVFASSAYTCTTFSHDSAYVFVTGVNNKGEVVGYWEVSGQGPHAFLRDSNGTMSSLKSPDGSDGFRPAGINNSGQI
ncbi:MAG TPA: hypothetical protein VN633_19435, partial [Bryobacteraceae bacterium]|nr:hypothetical protein [Bryobacteraceae bacterium]